MKLVTKLKILLLIAVTSTVVVVVVQDLQYKQIQDTILCNNVAFQILEKTSNFELLLHNIEKNSDDKEPIEQWLNRYNELAAIFEDANSVVGHNKHFIKLYETFKKIRLYIPNQQLRDEMCTLSLTQICTTEQNIEEVAILSEELVRGSLEYAKRSRAAAKDKRDEMHITAMAFSAIVTLSLISLAFFVARRTVYSIKFLQNGTKKLASGDLNYRMSDLGEDEFGDLARSFNRMVNELQQVTASKDLLNAEIAKRIEAEKELKKHQEYLENRVVDEVQKRRAKEVQLLEQARSAQLSDLLTNIAHHWRQPLNVVGLYIQEIIDAKKYGELTDEYLEELVKKSLDQLTDISKTLDRFRSVVIPRDNNELFSLWGVVKKVEKIVRPTLADSFITLDCKFLGDDSVKCKGNENSLLQAIYNILINAKEALEEKKSRDGKISLTLNTENGKSTITISNNGNGIDPDVLPRIFDPFFTTKSKVNRTGTGLYFAAMIIENEFGGDILVRNLPNGVEFTITLRNKCEKESK